jgi:2-iminobutanoate/2-iminopropanoate deaminase
MSKKIEQIETGEAPRAIGPYSQAVLAGSFLFVSGQIGIDPKTGQLVNNHIEQQTIQTLDNIEAILRSQDLNWSHVVKVEVFLTNFDDFQKMNTLYAARLGHHKPARQTVEVSRLPLNSLIEISCISYFG